MRRSSRSWLIGALLPLVVGGSVAQQGTASAHDVSSVRRIVVGSQNAQIVLNLAPARYRNARPIPASVIADMVRHIGSELQQYYAGSLLQQIETAMIENARLQRSGDRIVLTAGVSAIKVLQIDVVGDSATAVGHAYRWVGRETRRIDGTVHINSPRPTEADFTDTLIKTPSGWRIAVETGNYVPGAGPQF